MNYDPNMVSSGRMAKQDVTLTFQQWEYSADVSITVGGNCTGFDVIDAAVCRLYDRISKDGERAAKLKLVSADGASLTCEDEEEIGEDWLKRMLVCARITSIKPSERKRKALGKEAKP
jgi:hypothetical protein